MDNIQYQNLTGRLDRMERRLESIADDLKKIHLELTDDLSINKSFKLNFKDSKTDEPDEIVEVIKKRYIQSKVTD